MNDTPGLANRSATLQPSHTIRDALLRAGCCLLESKAEERPASGIVQRNQECLSRCAPSHSGLSLRSRHAPLELRSHGAQPLRKRTAQPHPLPLYNLKEQRLLCVCWLMVSTRSCIRVSLVLYMHSKCIRMTICKRTDARGHYRIWVENNTSRNDSPTPFSVRLTKDGESEDKSFEDCEEMEEVDCFELYVYFTLTAIVFAAGMSTPPRTR